MVTLTIDGVKVTVERGTSILDAARKAGCRIPTLCHDKRLEPYGACRLCVVEVSQGDSTTIVPACCTPVADDMQVATHTPKLIQSRRTQLELLLKSHPLQCPNCEACGDCQLQNLVHEYEIGNLPFPRESRVGNVDNDSHFILFNMNLCVRCGMCVRICEEVQGWDELSFIKRGAECEVSTDFGRPLNCEFCGQCATVCPVGAIRSKWLVGSGREFELKKTDTVCSFCSLGCTLTLGEKNNKTVYVDSPQDGISEGNLCVKGRYGWPYAYSQEKLTKPLIRKGDVLQEVEWDEALKFVADGFNRIKAGSGSNSLAGLGSARLTNEEAYIFNRFVRTVLETPHLDHAAGIGYRALLDGLAPGLGYAAGTNSIREIRNAEVILLLGADLTETHPVAKNEVIMATHRHRAKAIVVDAIKTKLTERSGMFLQTPPGYEYLVANAMLKCILDEGLYDKDAAAQRIDGLEELISALNEYAPEKVAQLTGLDVDLIRNVAKEYASAGRAVIILAPGINRTLTANIETAKAAANLALLTEKLGKPGCGVHVLGEKANSQGALDMGLVPNLLPGHVAIDDELARAKFVKAWGGASLPKEPGCSASDILDKTLTGEIKGLYIVGENPMDTYPDRQAVEKALRAAEFLVVQDMFPSTTAKMAHAVLPVASAFEKSGTYTSAERSIQLLKPTLENGFVKSDLQVFTALTELMGKTPMECPCPECVMAEIAELVPAYAGVSYSRLASGPLTWPCVDAEDTGKKVLYEGGFPQGKAKLCPPAALSSADDSELPFYLVTGVSKFRSGSFSQWSPALMQVSPEGCAEMNYKDLRALGLNDGDTVNISAGNGSSIRIAVKTSRRAPVGSVIVPPHFPGVKLNGLIGWKQAFVKIRVEKA